MPDEIINRANELLNNYERNPKKVISNETQLSFDLTEKNDLKERLKDIDPLKVTPLESLNILYELKEISKK